MGCLRRPSKDTMKYLLPVLALLCSAVAGAAREDVPAHAHVRFETTAGIILVELDGRRAPLTVARILELVDGSYYDGTVFHRVIPGFMIQGGGYTRDLKEKNAGDETIPNESGNGLQNLRGTVAMARLAEPHTANAQFFINVADNGSLNPRPDRWGYTVFGYVIEGMDVVDKIAAVPTGPAGEFEKDVPVAPVVIEKAARVEYGQ
jgi:cyclophilin family peptidyl-prolyl cis-trans isomerase